MATAAEIQTAYKAFYRTDLNATVAASIANSGVSLDNYIAGLTAQTAPTTGAAVAIASFVTGLAPTSAKLDSLKAAADAQVASYIAMGSANPELGAFEAFGRSFATDAETTAAFTAKYGSLSTADFIGVVYGSVYGATPSAAAAANLTAQIEYFTKLYTDNAVPNAAIAAKGAVLGQIVGYAFTSDAANNSNFDNQVNTLLSNIAKGDVAGYGKALPAAVNPGQQGVTIDLTATGNQVSPTAADPAFRSTAQNDTVNALGATLANGTKIDAGAGTDTVNALLSGGTKIGNGAGAIGVTLSNVEVLRVDGAGNLLDAKGVTGLTDIVVTNLDAASNATSIANLTSSIALSLNKSDGAVAFGFGTSAAIDATTINVSDAANLSLSLGGGAQFGAKAVTVNAATNTAATFALQDAQSLTLAGAGNTSYTLAGGSNASLKSIDASGAAGKIGLTLSAIANDTTVKLSAQDDIFSASLTTAKLVSVETGAGADRVVVSAVPNANVAFNDDGSLKAGLVVTDFTKGSDKIDLTVYAATETSVTLNATTLNAINIATTEKAAFDAVIAQLGANEYATFVYGGSTYVVSEGATDGVGTDGLIKVAGVTGLVASATGDILV